MELVECKKKYWAFILFLRKSFKEGFFDQSDITEEDHERFMKKNHRNYLVCVDNNKPVGFVGSVDGDIRVAVSEAHQKRGIGKFMLNSFLENRSNVYAKIKIDNESSLRLFESCGFEKKHYILER